MADTHEHVLDDEQWHPVVPVGEVWGMNGRDTEPRILWIGKMAVETPQHEIIEFQKADCITVEFRRYDGSWDVEGFSKACMGEVLIDERNIPVDVHLTEHGFGIIKIIPEPTDEQIAKMEPTYR